MKSPAASPVISAKADPVAVPSPSSVSRRYSKGRIPSSPLLATSPSFGPASTTSAFSGLSLGPGYYESPGSFYKSRSSASLSNAGDGGDVTPGGTILPPLPKTSIFLDNRLPTEYFKQDILKIIHRLRIHRWTKYVSPEMAKDLQVTRISGALTNAVYCVAPPTYIREVIKMAHKAKVIGGVDQLTGQPVSFNGSTMATAEATAEDLGYSSSYSIPSSSITKRVPPKLLLRVYGPQVENLIDRKSELNILARLSRRNIGPNLLGIFANGRFEQFLDAITLTKDDVRHPDVSIQIAKRMRELHDLIKLDEKEERQQGPCAFVNITKWLAPARDKLIQLQRKPQYQGRNVFKDILGVDKFDDFEAAIFKYKAWVESQYATDEKPGPKAVSVGQDRIKEKIVFSHNDTQYGNLLRILPPKGSPLLSPAFEHRQIVVIDFEYSGANTRGYDIVNHFCEWMSDYLSPEKPWKIHHDKYPTKSQRRNLIQGYVEHGYSTRAKQHPSDSSSQAAFFDDDAIEAEIKALEKEIENWRAGVSAHWAIWGLVQAVIDAEEDEKLREEKAVAEGYKFEESKDDAVAEAKAPEEEEEETEEEEAFDYIGYVKEKIDLFWGDLLKLGVVTKEEYSGPYVMIANDDKE